MSAKTQRLSGHAVNKAGLHLVAAEALLRGHSVELRTSGRTSWVVVDGQRVEVHTAKDEWPLTAPLVHPDADAVVFVRRSTDGRPHEFFIATRDEALAALQADMAKFLARNAGRRPHTPDSDQQTLHTEIAKPWRDRWHVLVPSP